MSAAQLNLFGPPADTYAIPQNDGTISTLTVKSVTGHRVLVRSDLPGHPAAWAVFERDGDAWRQATCELSESDLPRIATDVPDDLRKGSVVSTSIARWLDAAVDALTEERTNG